MHTMALTFDSHFLFKYVVIVLMLLFGTCVEESLCIKFRGSKLVKVYAETKKQRSLIESTVKQNKEKVTISQQQRKVFGSDDTTVDVLIVAGDFWQSWKKNFLQQYSFHWEITEADLGRALKAERLLLSGKRRFKSPSKDGHQGYSYDQVIRTMEDIQRKYGSIVEWYEIGKTYRGTPIQVLKVSSGSSWNRKIWIDATMHAREWITTTSILYLIVKIVEFHHENLYGVRNFDWYFLPLFNPDGYIYSRLVDRLWRKNRQYNTLDQCGGTAGSYGVDLNRNSDFYWGTFPRARNCSCEDYEGFFPYSANETRYVRAELIKLGNVLLYINLHSYMERGLWLLPYSIRKEQPPTDIEETKKLAKIAVSAMKRKYRIGHAYEVFGPPVTGDMLSWIKKAGIAKHSYAVEIRAKSFIIRDETHITESGNDILAAVLAMIKHI